jgi:hypothetical protein
VSANGGMTKEQVVSTTKSLDESTNTCANQSSPIYGTRPMGSSGRSSAGNDKESGFMGAPNSIKGPRR